MDYFIYSWPSLQPYSCGYKMVSCHPYSLLTGPYCTCSNQTHSQTFSRKLNNGNEGCCHSRTLFFIALVQTPVDPFLA